MPANPSMFHFMCLNHFRCSKDVPDSSEIDIITSTLQSDFKRLVMTIDDKVGFNRHVILCKSAARQLNVMLRSKTIFDIKEK